MTGEHKPLPPFAAYAGSRKPRILFIGEAWGAEEEHLQSPFVGHAGRFLYQLLGEVAPIEQELYARGMRNLYGLGFRKARDNWAEAAGLGFTNVLAFRPPDNKLENISVLKADLPKDYPLAKAPITRNGAGRYLREEFLGELERLREEIRLSNPVLIVLLGATALWALTGQPNIGAKRGVVDVGTLASMAPGRKFLPTYHPQALSYNFALRPIAKADLLKAWTQSQYREIRRPGREIIINPTIEDIQEWLRRLRDSPDALLACDIETKAGQITCLGFAKSRNQALVVPFWSFGRETPHYWSSSESEQNAWRLVGELLTTENPKLFQNGMYDLQYLWRFGLRPKNVIHDTMLLHHSMFPELQKGLGFLASIYTDEASWKLMRHEKSDVEKADE